MKYTEKKNATAEKKNEVSNYNMVTQIMAIYNTQFVFFFFVSLLILFLIKCPLCLQFPFSGLSNTSYTLFLCESNNEGQARRKMANKRHTVQHTHADISFMKVHTRTLLHMIYDVDVFYSIFICFLSNTRFLYTYNTHKLQSSYIQQILHVFSFALFLFFIFIYFNVHNLLIFFYRICLLASAWKMGLLLLVLEAFGRSSFITNTDLTVLLSIPFNGNKHPIIAH